MSLWRKVPGSRRARRRAPHASEPECFLVDSPIRLLGAAALMTLMLVSRAVADGPEAKPVQAPKTGASPRIEVVEPTYNFGSVFRGDVVKHVFVIKNAGQSQLVVGKVIAPCGCTAAKPAKTPLAPGEEAEIPVTLDTSALSGHGSHVITVLSNDPDKPQSTMTIEGTVKLRVAATPSDLFFGKVRRGKAEQRTVIIAAPDGKPVRVKTVSNSNAHIKASLHEAQASRGSQSLDVALMPTMPVGPFSDNLVVETDLGEVRVPVFGTITGNLNAEPAQVSFGIVPSKHEAVRYAKLENLGSRPIRVIGIESSNSSVAAQVEPLTAGKLYKLTVTLRRNTPDGQLRGNLTIRTDDPEQETVTLPYYAIVGSLKD